MSPAPTYLTPASALLGAMNRSERGASAVEYAMIIVAVAVIAAVAFGFVEIVRTIFLDAAGDVGCVQMSDGTTQGDCP